jgi:hypothetical protein
MEGGKGHLSQRQVYLAELFDGPGIKADRTSLSMLILLADASSIKALAYVLEQPSNAAHLRSTK